MAGEKLTKTRVTATGNVRIVAGVLKQIICTAAMTGTLTVYDEVTTETAANVIYSVTNPTLGQVITLNVPCGTGIRHNQGAAGTFVYVHSDS
jgi:hypothetical protein